LKNSLIEKFIEKNDPGHFFEKLGSSIGQELTRYDAVIFFETAAAGGIPIESQNHARVETAEEALFLDRKLRAVWSQHSKFSFVPHSASFLKKITTGLEQVRRIVDQLS
jgi:hypothetical protein